MSQLIQEIRLQQALQEKGADLPYVIDHATPKTIVDGKEYSLVFPRFLINTGVPKTKGMLFMGLITDKRMDWLKQFPNATIINSLRGRCDSTKVYDKIYFDKMAQAKFALCPNGDFTWTYRFFEAILCGAIPIIQHYCELYEGFHFYFNASNIHYNKTWVKDNLYLLEKTMML